jgi:xanthine dehydrogenase accessory factor
MGCDSEMKPSDVLNDAAAFYSSLLKCLAAGERVALCTILRLTGSGPRRAGAKMLVRNGGKSVGTVGGGVLEAEATQWAQEALQGGRPLCRTFALDSQQTSDEGMTCGGETEVLIEPFDGRMLAVRNFFAQVVAVLARGERGELATAIRRDGEDIVTENFLVVGGEPMAALSESGRALPEDILRAPTLPTPSLLERESVRYFMDPLAPPITVYVFGGGHIGMHLVPLCHLVGFRTVVVDDRADFISRDRFPHADDLRAVPSFDGAVDGIPLGEAAYVVIVTRGHRGDQAILRQALRRRPGYIGMIGSDRKRGLIFNQLIEDGFTQEDLARVACPVGLPIGAETPEEIAVSIVAQLVATRSAQRGKG